MKIKTGFFEIETCMIIATEYLLKLFFLQGINPKLEFSTNTTMQEASIVGSFQRFHATTTLSASEDEELVSTHRSILFAI